MLSKFTSWFLDLVIRAFKSIAEVFFDIAVTVTEAVLGAITALVVAIPAPEFLSSNSLGSLINDLPPDVLYFVGQLRLTEAFAVIAAGFTFRMARKILTLGQW